MKLVLLILLLVLFELAVLWLCTSDRLRAVVFAKPAGRGLLFLAAQAVFLTLLALGTYAESVWGLASRLSNLLGPDPVSVPLPAEYPSDPGLLATIEGAEPTLGRPTFGDREALSGWQASLRSHLLNSVFKIPEISRQLPARFTRLAQENVGSNVVRTRIVFETFDKSHIPGYLFEPEQAADSPAILVIPGHVPEGRSGLSQTAGLEESFQRAAALALARAGFVTLTLELRGFGELGRPYNTEHRLVAWNAILAGSFYKAIVIRDLKVAVDLLAGLPSVDPQRIGATGASYGGELSVTYAALDERIKAVAAHSYGGWLGRQIGVRGAKRNQPHYCHIIPGSSAYLYEEDMFLLLAPRPTQVARGIEDLTGDPGFEQGIAPAWRTFGAGDQVQVLTEPGGHDYFPEPAIRFFQDRL